MFTYRNAILVFIGLLVLSLIWMALAKEKRKLQEGGLIRTITFLFLLATAVGAVGLLYREPYDFLNVFDTGLIVTVAVCAYAWWYWDKRSLLDQEAAALLKWELPRACLLACLAAAVLTHALWATEVPRYRTQSGPLMMIAPLSFILLAPLTVVTAHRFYLRIPIIREFLDHWTLSVGDPPPVIEPTRDAKRIYFRIPEEEKGKETVDIDINAPNDEILSNIFHHILYRNVRDRRARNIQIALNNKKEYTYGLAAVPRATPLVVAP